MNNEIREDDAARASDRSLQPLELTQETLEARKVTAQELLALRIQEVRSGVEQAFRVETTETERQNAEKSLANLRGLGVKETGEATTSLARLLLRDKIFALGLAKQFKDIKGLGNIGDSLVEVLSRSKAVKELADAIVDDTLQLPTAKLAELQPTCVKIITSSNDKALRCLTVVRVAEDYIRHYMPKLNLQCVRALKVFRCLVAAQQQGALPASEEFRYTEAMREALTELSSDNCDGSQVTHLLAGLAAAGELLVRVGEHLKTDIDLSQLALGPTKAKLRKLNSAIDAAEKQYRGTDEARVLRLCKELMESTENSSVAKKTARQLCKGGSANALSILGNFKGRLQDYEQVKARVVKALHEAKDSMKPGESQPPVSLDDRSKTTTVEGVQTQEEQEAAQRELKDGVGIMLLDCGVEDEDLIQRLVEEQDLSVLSQNLAVLNAYTEIPTRARGLLVETNPAIITGQLEGSLTSFLKQVQRTIENARQLEGYEDAFSLEHHPKHYAFPHLLERTYAAAERLLGIVNRVRQTVQAARVQAEQSESLAKAIPAEEQALIDRLRAYVDKPYVAYAICRIAFLQSGGYNTRGVGRNLRDRRLQSVFVTPPVTPEVRECERQLVQVGLLAQDSRSTRSQGNLLLCPLREIANPDVRGLLVALTDADTAPKGQIPKLPFE